MKNYKLLPKITLWVLLIIGVIFSVMFYAGGSVGSHEVVGDFLDIPKFSVLCCWIPFRRPRKKAIASLCVVLGFIALIALCWFLGSPEKIEIVGYEGTDNQGFMAQLSDAIIYL